MLDTIPFLDTNIFGAIFKDYVIGKIGMAVAVLGTMVLTQFSADSERTC